VHEVIYVVYIYFVALHVAYYVRQTLERSRISRRRRFPEIARELRFRFAIIIYVDVTRNGVNYSKKDKCESEGESTRFFEIQLSPGYCLIDVSFRPTPIKCFRYFLAPTPRIFHTAIDDACTRSNSFKKNSSRVFRIHILYTTTWTRFSSFLKRKHAKSTYSYVLKTKMPVDLK